MAAYSDIYTAIRDANYGDVAHSRIFASALITSTICTQEKMNAKLGDTTEYNLTWNGDNLHITVTAPNVRSAGAVVIVGGPSDLFHICYAPATGTPMAQVFGTTPRTNGTTVAQITEWAATATATAWGRITNLIDTFSPMKATLDKVNAALP